MHDLPFTYAYIYDVLVTIRSAEEHKQHLCLSFRRLDENGVVINPLIYMYFFRFMELAILGYHVNSKGIRPLEDKLQETREIPQSTIRSVICVNF